MTTPTHPPAPAAPQAGAELDAEVQALVDVPKEFRCPKCGSTYFTTANAHTDSPTLHCGNEDYRCPWSGTWGDVAPRGFSTDPAAAFEMEAELARRGLATPYTEALVNLVAGVNEWPGVAVYGLSDEQLFAVIHASPELRARAALAALRAAAEEKR